MTTKVKVLQSIKNGYLELLSETQYRAYLPIHLLRAHRQVDNFDDVVMSLHNEPNCPLSLSVDCDEWTRKTNKGIKRRIEKFADFQTIYFTDYILNNPHK